MKNILTLLMVVALVITPAFAQNNNIEERVTQLITERIELDATSLEAEMNEEEFIVKVDEYLANCEVLAEELVDSPEALNEFKAVYNDIDMPARIILDPVVELVLEGSAARGLGETPENYPGYGYPDPDYKYRRGRELSRETLSVFWQKENKTTEEAQTIKTTMELSLAAGWGQENTASGNIENFSIGSTSNVNINGSMKTVCEVTFTTKVTMVTQCTVKYQRTKVWHELWRAKIKWFGLSTGDWALCGQTYEIVQEETGDEVVEVPPTFRP